MDRYLQEQPRDFLAVATPGAGKTTFALTLASWLLHHHVVQQVTVVAPTEHLKKQWAEAAARIGIKLDPEYSAGPLEQGVPRRRRHVRGRRRAAHAAPQPRASSARPSSSSTRSTTPATPSPGARPAWRRSSPPPGGSRSPVRPSGPTPTPSPSSTYEEGNDGIRRSSADYTYGYGNALADGVVRPVIFLSYSGNMRWRTKAGRRDRRPARRADDQGRHLARPGAPRSTRAASGCRTCCAPPTSG